MRALDCVKLVIGLLDVVLEELREIAQMEAIVVDRLHRIDGDERGVGVHGVGR